MTGQQLKNSILQLAIQGKLVPQDPNDEPASELLKRIRKEKEQLVREGKLKKKDLEVIPIAEDEKPFDLPNGWEWCKVKSIVLKITDGTHHSPTNKEIGDYLYVTAKNIKENGINLSNITYIDREVHEEIYSRCNPEYGDILYIKDGATTGICCINNLKEPFSLLSSVALLKSTSYICTQYLLYALRSPICYDTVRDTMGGTGITRITLTKIEQWNIPLPPLAEQKRIVAKIEELLPLVEEYGKAQEELNKLNATLPDKLRQSILQEAIMGKLVPQDPNDEPASELLKCIRKEKEQLVKDGKLKKKDLEVTPIAEDDKPFEIPESWEWVRMDNLIDIYNGYAFKSNEYVDKGIRIIRITNVQDGYMIDPEPKFYPADADIEWRKYNLIEGDLLMSLTGNVGRVAFLPNSMLPAALNQRVACLRRKISSYNEKYLFNYFLSPYFVGAISKSSKGMAQKNASTEWLKMHYIPLPPLAEQKRIVAKLDEILPKLNELK